MWEIEDELTRRAEQRLSTFIREAWHVLEPGTPYLHNWHIDAIAEHLEAVTDGDILRLLVNMPPRCSKSSTITIMWPVWEWITRPQSRYIFTSYSGSLSVKHSLDRRSLITSDWYQSRWGDRYKLSGDQNLKTEFQNNKRGVMVATSVGGTAAGKGGSRIVIDDPMNPQEAASEASLAEALNHVKLLPTRLDDQKTGAMIMVMQRVAEEDPSSLAKEQGWTELILPATAPERMVILYPRSQYQKVRETGDLLWPERLGESELKHLEESLGTTAYAGQYQQSPYSIKGEIFNRDWFLILGASDLPPIVEAQLTVDTAVTSKSSSDFTVVLVSGRSQDNDVIHLDMDRGRWEPRETVERIAKMWFQFQEMLTVRLRMVRMEDTDAAKVIRDWLHRMYPMIPVQLISHHNEDKAVRARRVSPVYETGRVKLLRGHWNDPFIAEHIAFRGDLMHKHDDMVDTGCYAVATLLRYNPVKAHERMIYRPAARLLKNQ
jgi:predicted phage terminase large subunit-like protein